MQSRTSFQVMIMRIRKIMPKLAAGVLILVYLVSALSNGLFLQSQMKAIAYGSILAIGIGFAIQIARMTLVFFPQLNPHRPNFTYMGEVIAVIMGAASILEIISLVDAAGMNGVVAISLSILMAMGVLAEIFLLHEIRFATEQELMGNTSKLKELKGFYTNRRNLKNFLNQLDDIELESHPQPNHSTPTRVADHTPVPATPTPTSAKPVNDVPIEPELILNGNGASKNGNGAIY